MIYPSVKIDLEKLRNNTNRIVNLCKEKDIEVMGITKGICAFLPAVRAIIGGGAKKLGDSRIKNIKMMRKEGIGLPIYLIRCPMLSEIKEVVDLADGSLNSELEVIKALSYEALAEGKKHKVILMVDVGDLREGVMPEDALDITEEILKLPAIEFEGIGTNTGCFGGVKPTYRNTKILADLANCIEKKYSIELKTISGGNSDTLNLLKESELPPRVNQLRIGEAILLGTRVNKFPELQFYRDSFVLEAEIIEVKMKPSRPIGEIACDAFGKVPVFEDKGLMRRAIAAIGRQDCIIEGLSPLKDLIEIIGSSSDHLILDVTKSKDINVGSKVRFRLSYSALITLMNSNYVTKNYS
ncbi:MAG TPA: alanine/ornithine racemase family PLP-dependent enzyme [Tepidanaerobacter syntrophicus]|uniref:alanine/ornithine racemase family PLP-dependent enzyme n=1 Tax=Tepidanaerobacter syntrophicus TaxID=224999 RepID=UPI0017547361|nr:alanine/ornithine racemase family PLP-dependent enzyme [Tepidanaerobacter syntrophicus]HHV82635.1 alanine/ornithine racemase family PLP-dependent enzyme [Tepidanaerobacter syntrophicus]